VAETAMTGIQKEKEGLLILVELSEPIFWGHLKCSDEFSRQLVLKADFFKPYRPDEESIVRLTRL
jgi:hypothetical protein